VIYMGLRNLAAILGALREAGLDPKTPACIIENGTLPGQRQRVATLGTLSGDGFSGPAIVVIGEVVRFATPRSLSAHAPLVRGAEKAAA
jgi:siroheme synthase